MLRPSLSFAPSAVLPSSQVVEDNLENTVLWGKVESVSDIGLEVMLQLTRYAANNSAC